MVVSGCGSGGSHSAGSSADAVSLLHATFSGRHTVRSGRLGLTLTIVPSGSSEITKPITVSFSGPFQAGAAGELPASDLTVTASAQGETARLAIISTGTAGYITADGTSYRLPASSYKQLGSRLSSVSSGTGSDGSGLLGKLGIQPLRWLSDPRVVGHQAVGGAPTTHISAAVNVPGLLLDLSKLISHAAALGAPDAGKLSAGLSASEQARISRAIRSPSFDLWTGDSDHTLRKLRVGLTLPVSGSLGKDLGGLSSVKLALTLQYSDLDQPQTITAPASVRPFSDFEAGVAAALDEITGGLSGTATGTSTATTGATSGLSGVDERYSQCVTKAAGKISKLQKCSALLGGG